MCCICGLSRGVPPLIDDEREVDGLTASALAAKLGEPCLQRGPVSPRTIFHRQLTNIGVHLFDLTGLVLGFFNLIRENACHTFNHLPFPLAHLRWVELALGWDLLNRLVTAQRLKCHSSFKLV